MLARFSTLISYASRDGRDYFVGRFAVKFWSVGDGCSQRYPHPGYAQEWTIRRPKGCHLPVDRNGDSRAAKPCLGVIAYAKPDFLGEIFYSTEVLRVSIRAAVF